MAESVLDLVNVEFQDATSHVSITSEDVIGMVMPYYWGESDKIITLYKGTFFEMFPETLPLGSNGVNFGSDGDSDVFTGYAQIKSAFNHGAGAVEIYRPSAGWKWQRLTISSDGVVSDITGEDTRFDETKAVNIGLKYAGFIPKSLAYGYEKVSLGVELADSDEYTEGKIIKINVYGLAKSSISSVTGNKIVALPVSKDDMYEVINTPSGNPFQNGWYVRTGDGDASNPYVYTKTTSSHSTVQDLVVYCKVKSPKNNGWYTRTGDAGSYTYNIATVDVPANNVVYYEVFTLNVLEAFEGATNSNANIGGEDIYLENVVSNSRFISVRVSGEISKGVASAAEVIKEFANYTKPVIGEEFLNGVKEGYNFFRDYESSNATLVINPFVKNGNYVSGNTSFDFMEEVDSLTASLVAYRKNCMAVFGYPIDEPYTKDDILNYFGSGVASNALGNKFCIALQGREYVSVFGQRFVLNCVGGYCGATVNIAKTVRINQIASGDTYGLYGGSLKQSLLSGAVIDLMEKGIDSVYTAKRGNHIFGTRTMYSRQNSYFGKINVMRVCSMILRNIFPIAIETLHTDAASNPITRASLSTMLNSIIDNYIANQNLHADSYADCSDALNTDYLTKGGTVLNIVLMLHFIGLVERINIKIVATDTSVTAEFV